MSSTRQAGHERQAIPFTMLAYQAQITSSLHRQAQKQNYQHSYSLLL
jgi:hypothetical protein